MSADAACEDESQHCPRMGSADPSVPQTAAWTRSNEPARQARWNHSQTEDVRSSHAALRVLGHVDTLIWLLLFSQEIEAMCDPIDGSPPGSSIYGILQTRAHRVTNKCKLLI